MTRTIPLLPLIIIIILAGCGDRANTMTGLEPKFQEFLNRIPKKSLPVNLSCGLPNESESTADLAAYSSFIPKSADRVFGQLDVSSDSYRLLIFGYTGDDIYPVLFSFDNKGEIIDSLNLILNPCGAADDMAIPHSFVTIDNRLTVRLTDTTRLIHYPGYWKKPDFDDESTPDSTFVTTGDFIVDSVKVSSEEFKINDRGSFVKK